MTELAWLFVGLTLGGSISAILCLWRRVLRCEQEIRRTTKNSKYE